MPSIVKPGITKQFGSKHARIQRAETQHAHMECAETKAAHIERAETQHAHVECAETKTAHLGCVQTKLRTALAGLSLIAALALVPAGRGGQAYAASRSTSTSPSTSPSAHEAPQALHLMNDTEFATFLAAFDAAQIQWQEQMKSLQVRSLSLNVEPEDRAEMAQSYGLCVRALQMMEQQTRELSRKQTMKGDLLLLVDMNDLARNLDELDRDLASAGDAAQYDAAPKALGYVREVLGINTALAAQVAEFQNHVFAFAKLIDAKLGETEDDTPAPLPRS